MKNLITLYCILISHFALTQTFDVETLWHSGSDENRINLVILSDGYQESELSQFIIDANSFTDSFFDETPYKEYKNFFNVFAIKVPSNESGASHPGTATDVDEPAHPVSTVDNYFGSAFDSFNIHRLLVPTNSPAIINVLANNFPTFDQVVILVNSPYYGGSGGTFATASLHADSNEIAIHELGHSFVNLADEYYAGDVFAAERINMTQETLPDDVRWRNWLGTNDVGIYQHCCGGNSSFWYKPHEGCKMESLGLGFCSVCTEGTIERIHDLVDLTDSYSPANTNTISISSPTTFMVDLVTPDPNTLDIEWTFNGSPLDTNYTSVEISPDQLNEGENELSVTIEDPSSYLRVDNHPAIHNSSVSWDIISGVLPIKLIDFTAIPINNEHVQLDWQTASEFENDFFTIEKSKDGISWEIMENIDGAGNSSTVLTYSTIDSNPYLGVSYYRLKQTDFDGQSTYSDIRSVTINYQVDNDLHIYPNPANSILTIEGDSIISGEIRILNVVGQDVSIVTSTTEINNDKINIDVSQLDTGIYFLVTDTTTKIVQIIK